MLLLLCVDDICREAKLIVSISMLVLQKSGQSRLSFFPAHRKARLCADSRPVVLLVPHDLRLMALDRCSLHGQVSRADRLDSHRQVLNRLLGVGLHFHSGTTSGVQPLSRRSCRKTRTTTLF